MTDKETGNWAFFQNRSCEYFPCHQTDDMDSFNCLFCYCPLYALGEGCGGSFRYTDQGVKDCSNCLLPHKRDSAEFISKNFDRVAELAKRKSGSDK